MFAVALIFRSVFSIILAAQNRTFLKAAHHSWLSAAISSSKDYGLINSKTAYVEVTPILILLGLE